MHHERSREVLRFVITGGVCFVIEFALLVFLRDVCHLPTLVANGLAFLVAVSVNYLICLKWVFTSASHGAGQRASFFLTSVVGLLLNELLMFILGKWLGEDGVLFALGDRRVNMYMLNKCIATILVMVWNYFSKRYVLSRER